VAVVKVIELVGESPRDWTDAVQSAVKEAAKTVDHITGVEVTNFTAHVQEGRIVGYKADVKVAFTVDENR
jgi:flavin-binding protein dodecin